MLYKLDFNLWIEGFHWFFSITVTFLHFTTEKGLGTSFFVIWFNSWHHVLEIKLNRKKNTIHSGNFHTEKRLGTGHFEVALYCFGNDIASFGGLLMGCIRNWVWEFVLETIPNLVPRVLSCPPYGAREGRVGENPGNEVEQSHSAIRHDIDSFSSGNVYYRVHCILSNTLDLEVISQPPLRTIRNKLKKNPSPGVYKWWF